MGMYARHQFGAGVCSLLPEIRKDPHTCVSKVAAREGLRARLAVEHGFRHWSARLGEKPPSHDKALAHFGGIGRTCVKQTEKETVPLLDSLEIWCSDSLNNK